MQLFLTSVLPFLAHKHSSAAAFLTCRHHNFHSSIIPEFLSDEGRVKSFCEATQQNKLEARERKQYKKMYKLFVQTPLMQFSPSLIVSQDNCTESILEPLLETKYFTRTLQRCSFVSYPLTELAVPITNELLQSLSRVQSLTKLDLEWRMKVKNSHMKIIINSFPSLETLLVPNASCLRIVTPSKAAPKTLRNLTLEDVGVSFATEVVPHFSNLRRLMLKAKEPSPPLNLRRFSSSLPRLTDLHLEYFHLENIDSLKNLAHLSSVQFMHCHMPDSLSFLSQETSLADLTFISLQCCGELSTSSFASLSHAPNLQVLAIRSHEFANDCFQYLENMVHLRKLDLKFTSIVGDSRSLKTLMQNLFQLEDLNLCGCRIGNQGAIAGAFYTNHSRLRVLNLECCSLVDDDLNGIGALKNSLEVLDVSHNNYLTNEALVHCRELVKLKLLKLGFNSDITDLSPLEGCSSLEELDVRHCRELKDLVKLMSSKLRRCLGIEDQ